MSKVYLTPEIERHYTPAELAERLALSRQSVLRLCREGAFGDVPEVLPKELRIPASAVVRYLAMCSRRIPA